MSCTHGKTEAVRRHDSAHRGDLGRGTLSVSEVVLSDFFSHRNHNTLPSDHRPQAQGQSDGNLYPGGNEFGSQVDVLLVIGENFLVVRTEFRLVRLLHDA